MVASAGIHQAPNVVAPAIALLSGLLLLVIVFKSLVPFIGSLLWAAVLTVAAWGVVPHIQRSLGIGRGAASLCAGAGYFIVLAVPLIYLSVGIGSLAQDVWALVQSVANAGLPPPPAFLAHVPLIGGRMVRMWQADIHNVPDLLTRSESVLVDTAALLLRQITDLVSAIGELLFGILLAIQALAAGPAARRLLRRAAFQVAGPPGLRALDATRRAIIAVSLWLIASALVESALSGVGFWIAGLQLVPILTFVCFVLRVLQIPPWPVWLGALLWLWWSEPTPWPAVVLGLWIAIVVIGSGRALAPWLKHHRPEVPSPLLFLAVLGGLLNWGFSGMFLGAASVAVLWSLIIDWLRPTVRRSRFLTENGAISGGRPGLEA
jgi:predicted PurR-regulated permease PerM